MNLVTGNRLYYNVSRMKKQKYTVLSVRVSKENETNPINAEQIFAALHGIHRNISLWERLKGIKQEHISFEIANQNRNIRFYIWFPSQLKNTVESQVYAQYPDCEMTEVTDYTAPQKIEIAQPEEFPKKSTSKMPVKTTKNPAKKTREFSTIELMKNAVVGELGLTDPDIFPIKRYVQYEDKLTRLAVDPIAAITATLSKLNEYEDQAWIQIITRPMPDKWRILYTKCVRILKKGLLFNIEKLQKIYARAFCTRKPWHRIVFFPVYMVFWFQGIMAGANISMTETKSSVSSRDLEEETSRQHERESSTSAAMDKVVKLLYEVGIRIAYLPKNQNIEEAQIKVREIAGSFKQFNQPHLNGFKLEKLSRSQSALMEFRKRKLNETFVLNTEELATIYHMPNMTVKTPNIHWVKSKKIEPPTDLPTPDGASEEEFTLLGKTNFRGMREEFGIRADDRRRHIYIIGKTGMGKSTLLENMIYSDIANGKGVGVIDPHGDLADAVLKFIPSDRTNDVVVFDPSDREWPVAFNMLENVDPAFNSIVASGLVGIFKKIYADSWGPRLEHILRNTILALLEYPNTTMLGILRILSDETFRRQVVKKITDPMVKSFWMNEFGQWDQKFRTEAISPIQNKVGQFLSSPIIRNIVGQPKSSIDLRFAMDKGKIIVCNLSKGKIGEDNSALLGAMLITKFQLDAMSRANIVEKERKDFSLYVDEFQNFATEAFATILSEARKYRLNITMANQYIAQMPDEVRDAVFGNVGSLLSFQVGFDDAEYISQQFAEEVTANDLINLDKFSVYGRILVDLMPTKTFSFNTFPSPEEAELERYEKIMNTSRQRYAVKREIVEDKIRRWSENIKKLDEPNEKPKNRFS